MAEFRKKMKDEGKAYFAEQVKLLFSENPTLLSFSWNQYTPYFNDGEPCTFSANTDYPVLQIEGDDETNEQVLEDNEESYYKDDKNEGRGKIWSSVSDFLKSFDDDDMELLFGDHARVVVNREEITIKDYDHD